VCCVELLAPCLIGGRARRERHLGRPQSGEQPMEFSAGLRMVHGLINFAHRTSLRSDRAAFS
jgi:hypothetical protein